MIRRLSVVALIIVAVAFAFYVSRRPMDFRVYWYEARGVFEGTKPVYGAASGLGWPMHYRYPPLFLLLFAPLAMLPIGWAAGIWVLAKFAVLGWILRFGRRRPQPAEASAYLFVVPYLVEDFRYGNAQFFIVALTIAGLLFVRERPQIAAGALALGISIKVWPLFFLPYLAVRREWKVVAYAIAFVAILAMLPSFYFGVGGNLNLLGQWFDQEFHTQLSESEIWFPNQSLRGVLMRYLTVIDYSKVPDSNYANINIASMDPATVRTIWLVLAAGIYAAFLVLSNRRRENNDALAFCLVALLEPFTQKYALCVLLLPAMAAAGLMKYPRLRILIYCATVLVLVQPLAQGATAQRLLQVLGMDFAAVSLLTIALTLPAIES